MDTITIHDDADQCCETDWIPTDWIGCGKKYYEIPPIVETARRNILKIPPSFTNNLPAETLSIAELLLFELPPTADPDFSPMDDGTEWFSNEMASSDIEALIPFLPVPNHDILTHLLNNFGQAWFDGRKTVRTWINPEIKFPFWVLEYWTKVLAAAAAKGRWILAASWIDSTGKTMEKLRVKRTIKALWKRIAWDGNLPGFASIPVVDLAKFFSQDYLAGNLVDAMMDLLSIRLTESAGPISESALVLLLPNEDGTKAIGAHPGAQKYLRKYASWFRSPDHTHLYFVLHRPPDHWTACSVDFKTEHIHYGDSLRWERPLNFFLALESWTADHFPDSKFLVTDDLPCASQTDGYNCPIISVNTIAHNTLGDPLWTPETAQGSADEGILRYLAARVVCKGKDPNDLVENLLAVNPDINDARMENNTTNDAEVAPVVAVAEAFSDPPVGAVIPVRGVKRPAEPSGDGDDREKKVAKTSESTARAIHSFFDGRPKVPAAANPKSKSAKQASSEASSSTIGISKSATAARKQREAIKKGKFQASSTRLHNFQEKCRGFDSGACFEDTASRVQCSICKVWKKMKEPYSVTRFREHVEAGNCSAPPAPESESDPSKRTLDQFTMVKMRPKSRNLSPPPTVIRPCPGLTRAFDELVGDYLDRTVATGGGAHSVNHYSAKLFNKQFLDLRQNQKDAVRTACFHDYIWRNDTSPGIMACYATGVTPCLKTVEVDVNATMTPPCSSCKLLRTVKVFKNAIRREAPEPSNLRFVPHVNQNAHAGMLYAKFRGLEELVSEDNEWSLERRFFQHVVSGKFKDDTVFRGIMQAKVMAKDREIRGVGNQNFKYDTDMDALFGLIHTISPRAYRELAKHFPVRTERSIKHIISTTPRFPIGIKDETFLYAQQYCENYKYPHGAPLSLSVDDTKLFPALRPLYDGVNQKWFIVGTTGEHVEVLNPQGMHEALDKLEATAELATKLRLWVLQIPLPGVPPLVLAIAPLPAKVKGPQLAEWQIRLMEGLVSRGFRITSSGGDGASVERDCQRRTASTSKLKEFRIKHPDPAYPDIVVQLWDLDGNVWVVIQDAKHGRKTFQHNTFSGARGLTLGNFVVFYRLVHTLGMKPHTPLYRRDFIKSDRMDDPSAARFFSADFLEQASEDPEENLGLVILINGLLGLIVIHRDHLGTNPCPLLPWFNASEPNEHCFSGLWDISPDMTMQQAILGVPKLRAKLTSAVRIQKTQTDFKKQASGYCHTYYSSENIDYALLSAYPSDIELSQVYAGATQENDALWAMLGVHPDRIENAPTPGLAPPPPPDPAFEHLYLQADINGEPEDPEKSAAEELQQMIDNLKTTVNLSRAADEQLDACVMASVALSMDEPAKIEDLPETNPERFAEIQKDIALAMSTQPAAFMALLQGMADSALKNPDAPASRVESPPVSHLLIDISSDDLSPFVTLRREHQTEEARKGVRTYKSSGTYKNHKTGEVKPLSDRQILARQMQAIIRQDQERGSSTGLNRKVRWTGDATSASKPKVGNAANAELAASGRSKEAIKRRRLIFANIKCLSTVAEARIGSSSDHTMEDGCYGFAMIDEYLPETETGNSVITMYSKNGGKAGAHSWTPTGESIGALSFVIVQVYEHEYRRHFKIIPHRAAALGTIRFEHLPANSFLALLPKDEGVKTFHNHVEIGVRAHKIFEELVSEKELLAKAVSSLNTVRRKGKVNIHITELAEDDCEED
ncbi:hypothetical protein DFH09DRAFT_1457048 [Mycena vulgaris]|nr:hypothetical protein DFH09DRAFT_1457048 [Mycena vulgaris]